jgi:hypothetical protein
VGELKRIKAAAESVGLTIEQFLPYLSETVAARPVMPASEIPQND